MIVERKLMRRVAGHHDQRLDGISDLLGRARDASVFDIGCNRGLVGFEFANNGATVVHGCDIDEPVIEFCRELFIDLRNCESCFQVVDLTAGPSALQDAFGEQYRERYDFVLMLATLHKLKRVMHADHLNKLLRHFGKRTGRYFGWRGYPDEVEMIDREFMQVGLRRVQYSELSETLGSGRVAAIWRRD